MDDPWGSPWTTADNHDKDKAGRSRDPSPSRPSLAPPAPALLSTGSTPRLPSFSAPSPWADDNDDSFGGWQSQGSLSGWGGWAGESWGANGSGSGRGSISGQRLTPTPTPTDGSFRRASPSLAWPSSAATSPGLNPLFLGRKHSNSLLRQPSPDPWASEAAHEASLTTRPRPSRSPSLRAPSFDVVRRRSSTDSRRRSTLAPGMPSSAQAVAGAPLWETGDSGLWQEEEAICSGPVPAPQSQEGREYEGRTAREADSQGTPSRRSSWSNTSHHGEEQQDSPITSIDEESRDRPRVQRKPSKVQELVEMYDGLARSPSPEATSVQFGDSLEGFSAYEERDVRPKIGAEEPVVSEKQEADEEERDEEADADFGDFEQADEQPPNDTSTESPDQILDGGDPIASPTSPVQEKSRLQRRPEKPLPARRPSSPPLLQKLETNFGSIKFEVNSEDISKIFDTETFGPTLPTHNGQSPSDIPDRIVRDTFSTISERKTWYRISRQGSSRKHDAGDDDSYRRVAWPTSVIHEETLKVVRRWLEEDSITGRPTLGGTSAKGTMFGWGDSAASGGGGALDLDQIFGRKRKPVQGKTAVSKPQLSLPPAASIDSTLAVSHSRDTSSAVSSPIPARPPAAAQFGWSSASNGTATRSGVASDGANASVDTTSDSSISISTPISPVSQQPRPIQSPVSNDQRPKKTMSTPLAPIKRPVAGNKDDDDDWGEMVSSPPANLIADPLSVTIPNQAAQETAASTRTQSLRDAAASHPSSSTSEGWPTSGLSFFDTLSPTGAEPNPPTLNHGNLSPAKQLRQISHAPPTSDRSSTSYEDAAVKQIISSLPNLSYMMR